MYDKGEKRKERKKENCKQRVYHTIYVMYSTYILLNNRLATMHLSPSFQKTSILLGKKAFYLGYTIEASQTSYYPSVGFYPLTCKCSDLGLWSCDLHVPEVWTSYIHMAYNNDQCSFQYRIISYVIIPPEIITCVIVNNAFKYICIIHIRLYVCYVM